MQRVLQIFPGPRKESVLNINEMTGNDARHFDILRGRLPHPVCIAYLPVKSCGLAPPPPLLRYRPVLAGQKNQGHFYRRTKKTQPRGCSPSVLLVMKWTDIWCFSKNAQRALRLPGLYSGQKIVDYSPNQNTSLNRRACMSTYRNGCLYQHVDLSCDGAVLPSGEWNFHVLPSLESSGGFACISPSMLFSPRQLLR